MPESRFNKVPDLQTLYSCFIEMSHSIFCTILKKKKKIVFLQSISIFHIYNVANISISSISKSKPFDSLVFV